MKFLAYILAAVLVCVAAQSSHACPVALEQRVERVVVQYEAAPVIERQLVEVECPAVETAAIVVPQAVRYIDRLEQVDYCAVDVQRLETRNVRQVHHVKQQRQPATPVRDAIQNLRDRREDRQALRQAQRAAQHGPKAVILAPAAVIYH